MTDQLLVTENTNACGSTLRAKEAPKPLIKGPNHGKELLHILHAFLTFFSLRKCTSCLWKEYETKWTLGLTGTCLFS